MWMPLAIALTVGLASSLGVCVWLWTDRRHLQRDRDRLSGDLSQRERAIEGYLAEIEQLRQTLGEKDRELAEHRVKLEGADDKFKALAQSVLGQVNEQFQQWAKKTLESEQRQATGELDKRKQAIESLLKPISDSLDKHAKAIAELETKRESAYQTLRHQLTEMHQSQGDLRRETANLVTALRRPEVRGRWGEMQLRRVAELAGMIENCDFTEQTSVRTEDGTLRPDMIVRMPSERIVVVDAKTPLDAFINAVDCQDDEGRQRHLQQHADQIDVQIRRLSSKQYAAQFSNSPDFVVLFIPGESFLQAAVQLRPSMLEQAMEKGVLIATPSTLIALLKTVALGWREQRLAENAQRISELGRELHSRLGTAMAHVANLGKAVGSTVNHYNKLVGSIESSVLPQARRFQELGADSHKELPAQLTPIDTTPRQTAAAIAADSREAADHDPMGDAPADA